MGISSSAEHLPWDILPNEKDRALTSATAIDTSTILQSTV